MFKKEHTLISEIMAWAIFTALAFVLALPLSTSRYKNLSWENMLLSPASSIGYNILSNTPNISKTPPQKRELALLEPSPDLLKTVSANTHPQPKFNTAVAKYETMIQRTARQHKVSPVLLKAIIQTESNFNPTAVSNNGAVGLMQLMPSTARSMGIHDPMDPQNNITAGTKYISMLLTKYNDDEALALAAYNAGPEAVRRFNTQVPPFKETQAFVAKVMLYYNSNLDS
jgi:soluble lytic murein transglycosylase-like protein